MDSGLDYPWTSGLDYDWNGLYGVEWTIWSGPYGVDWLDLNLILNRKAEYRTYLTFYAVIPNRCVSRSKSFHANLSDEDSHCEV